MTVPYRARRTGMLEIGKLHFSVIFRAKDITIGLGLIGLNSALNVDG